MCFQYDHVKLCITKTRPCNIQLLFTPVKMPIFDFLYFFHIFAKNINCGYTRTHNLCFRAKIRKNVYPCKPQWGVKGVYITRTCFHDAFKQSPFIYSVSSYFDLEDKTFGFDSISSLSLIIFVYFREALPECGND